MADSQAGPPLRSLGNHAQRTRWSLKKKYRNRKKRSLSFGFVLEWMWAVKMEGPHSANPGGKQVGGSKTRGRDRQTLGFLLDQQIS